MHHVAATCQYPQWTGGKRNEPANGPGRVPGEHAAPRARGREGDRRKDRPRGRPGRRRGFPDLQDPARGPGTRRQMSDETVKYTLPESQIPTHWVNLLPDLPGAQLPPPPPPRPPPPTPNPSSPPAPTT